MYVDTYYRGNRRFTPGLARGTLRTLAVSASALLHFNLESLCFCYLRCREMHLQNSVAELRRHFLAIGIFGQRKAAPEATVGALDAMEFPFLIFLFALAFPGNTEDAVFDCYPQVILLYFRQVSFE